jgi:hypothetical protein
VQAIESFNGKFRDECLSRNWFVDLRHAREVIESWRMDYNTVRPHSSLGYRTPEEFAAANGCGKDGGFATLKTLRVSHFPPATTTAVLFRPLQWNQKPWELRYEWTNNGGQGTALGHPCIHAVVTTDPNRIKSNSMSLTSHSVIVVWLVRKDLWTRLAQLRS